MALGTPEESCIVLAGGSGTRLRGVTGGGNKHLVPLCGQSALHHVLAPVRAYYGAAPGVLVTNPAHVEAMRVELALSGLGHWMVCEQAQPDGTLSALRCAASHVRTATFGVHLGDNLFSWRTLPAMGAAFASGVAAELYVKEVPREDSERFAVASIEGVGDAARIISVIEKPPANHSLSDFRVLTGFARFNRAAFNEHAPRVERSARGEYEITSLITRFVEAGLVVAARHVDHAWLDYGTEESYRAAEELLRVRKEQA